MTTAQPVRRRFTVDEYYKMGKARILCEDERVELIEGDIIQMPPIGGPHASRVNRLNYQFVLALANRAMVTVQNPLRLNTESEPVPDVLLLKPRDDFYESHPTPSDVLLLVEVSDTTLRYDLRTKVPLYARLGVPEVWVEDLRGDVLRVFRDPAPTGYGTSFTCGRGEHISPLAFPDLTFAVDDILG